MKPINRILGEKNDGKYQEVWIENLDKPVSGRLYMERYFVVRNGYIVIYDQKSCLMNIHKEIVEDMAKRLEGECQFLKLYLPTNWQEYFRNNY